MTITYPLTAPSSKHSSVIWNENNIVSNSHSPFTGAQQVHNWGAGYWSIEVSFDPLDRVDAAEWIAFLSKLRGQYGTFYFGDYLTRNPRGTGAGTPLVKGANQSGHSLLTDGWGTSQTVLKANDRIQINDSLYRVLSDVTSDGSGNATIDLWPALRVHADNSTIIKNDAAGLFRLSSNQNSEQIARSKFWQIGFEAVEAL